ncbi:S8 family serine peptidase [Phaeacidiphilus oryzae]|uniref:S8 family serine peptidase n=1 Tax=Phaeacidiphilus oryzae TaxID=348818 RepID=UPI0007C74C80|nr:S8 family serine peptidase [Phaeacidiphilus oryzae]
MAFTRVLRAVVGAALAGGLVLAVSPTASADQVRDAEWALKQWEVPQNVWPITTGAGQTVAVIDSGVRASHVDLKGQVLPGKDFLTPADKGWVDHSASGQGHGTAMASAIAGHGHGPGGSEGMKGIAPGAKILPIAVALTGDSNNAAATSHQDVAAAIRWAVDHHAGVINMSIGNLTSSAEELSAVAYAEQHNVVLVAAAGNDSLDNVGYPAKYPGVISVGGLTKADTVWSGENYGHITVVAPAENIVSANNGSDTQYGMGTGTSPAAAYVSGLAALIRAKYPDLTAGQVVNRIIRSAGEPKGIKAPDAHWGYGVILPHAALTENIPAGPASGPLPQAKALSSQPGGTAATGSSGPGSQAAGSKSSSNGVVIGVLVGLVVVVAVIVVIVLLVRRRNRNSGGGPGGYGGGSGGAGGGQYPPYPQQTPQTGGYQPPAGMPGGGGGQPPQSVYQNNPYAQPQAQPPQQPPYGGAPGGGGHQPGR